MKTRPPWTKNINASTTFAQAVISCRLDYCNSLLCGITADLLSHLQSVQNAAARLVTGARYHDHITSVLRWLHWLPVRQRVNFKLAVYIYLALHNTTAHYLVEDCQLVPNTGRCGRWHFNSLTYKNMPWWQELFGCWPAAVEQFTIGVVPATHWNRMTI